MSRKDSPFHRSSMGLLIITHLTTYIWFAKLSFLRPSFFNWGLPLQNSDIFSLIWVLFLIFITFKFILFLGFLFTILLLIYPFSNLQFPFLNYHIQPTGTVTHHMSPSSTLVTLNNDLEANNDMLSRCTLASR